MKNTFDLEAFEREHGKVYGRDSEKARIYRHSGNWHYEPANFFAAAIIFSILSIHSVS